MATESDAGDVEDSAEEVTALEAFDRLRDVGSDEVADLADALESEYRRLRKLEAKVTRMERQQQRLANGMGLSLDEESWEKPEAREVTWDHRDQSVLRAIAEDGPKYVSLQELRAYYRENTDVRQTETLRERTRQLVRYGPFEDTAEDREWEYTGA